MLFSTCTGHTGDLQGRGQALYSALGFGAGGAFDSFIAGYAWDAFSPQAIFVAAALMTSTAFLLALRWFDGVQPERQLQTDLKGS